MLVGHKGSHALHTIIDSWKEMAKELKNLSHL